jgi:hypothetical protein
MGSITEHSGREGSFHSRLDRELAGLGISYDDVFSLIVSDTAYAERICHDISLATMGVGQRQWHDSSNDLDYLICKPKVKTTFKSVSSWARDNKVYLVPKQVPDWPTLTEALREHRFVDVLSAWGENGFQAYSKKAGAECVPYHYEFASNDAFLVYADPEKRPKLADVTPKDWKSRRLLVALESIGNAHALDYAVRKMGYSIGCGYGQYGSKMEPPFPTDRMFIATDLHTGGLDNPSQLSTWSADGTAWRALGDGSHIGIDSLILANKRD